MYGVFTDRCRFVLGVSIAFFALSALCAEPTAPSSDARTAPAAETSSETARTTPSKPTAPTDSVRTQCIARCNRADAECGTAVRQARQQCSRRAATSGRDPMTMRNDDHVYFCGFFRAPRHCASGEQGRSCKQRFEHHYSVCIDAIQDNIAALRHDCVTYEREARNVCREELRACEAECTDGRD